MADYIDFAEKKKAGKIGTFDEYFAQMDLLDGPSEIAREILKLFGSRESASDIAEYVNKYCEAAAQSDPTGGLFGEAGVRTRIQIWNDATKTVDEARGKNAQRHSIAVSPTLREDIEAALNTDRAKGEYVRARNAIRKRSVSEGRELESTGQGIEPRDSKAKP